MSEPLDLSQFSEQHSAPPAVSDRRTRPAGLIAVAVISLMLGCLGVFTVVGGAFGLVANRVVADTIIQQAEANPEDKELQVQAQMQSASAALYRRYFVFNVINLSCQFAVCLGLVIGAIQVLRLAPTGRKLLLVALLVTSVFEVARFYPMYQMQAANLDIVANPDQFVELEQDDPELRQQSQVMSVMMEWVKILAMVVLVGWVAAKVMFYLFAARYLTQPKVQGLFLPSTA